MGEDVTIQVPTIVENISPIGFHHYAEEFLGAAQQFRHETARHFSPVRYYLLCHAIELVLKAYLLVVGVPKADLPKPGLRHDLTAILARAKGKGLEHLVGVSPEWDDTISKANEYYNKKGFEYFEVSNALHGYKNLPSLATLEDMTVTLVHRLRGVCLSSSRVARL